MLRDDAGPDAAVDAGADSGPDDASRSDAGTDASSDACEVGRFFQDSDGDGHGDPGRMTIACTQPSGFVGSSDDCDDACPTCFPGAIEACDALDNDCDRLVDLAPADAACADPMICVRGGCGPLTSSVQVAIGSHEARLTLLASSPSARELALAISYYLPTGSPGPLHDLRFADRDVVFDPTAQRVELVSRVDGAGRVVWATALSFVDSTLAGISDVAIDDGGRVLVVGSHTGLNVGALSLPRAASVQSFVLLLSPTGMPLVLRSATATVTSCAIGPAGLVIGGWARESAEFSIVRGTTSDPRGFVASLVPTDLGVSWSKVFGTGTGSQVTIDAVGSADSVVAMGTFQDDAPLAGTTTTFRSAGLREVLLARFSPAGALTQSMSTGTTVSDSAKRVVMRGDDALCVMNAGMPAFTIGTAPVPAATRTGVHDTGFVWRPDGSVTAARRLDALWTSFPTSHSFAGALLAGASFSTDGFALPEMGVVTRRDVVLVEVGATGAFTSAERIADIELVGAAASTRVDAIAGAFTAAEMVGGVALPAPPAGSGASYVWFRPRP